MSGNNNPFNLWHIQTHGILKPEGTLGTTAPSLGWWGACGRFSSWMWSPNALYPSFRNMGPASLEANGSKNHVTQSHWHGHLPSGRREASARSGAPRTPWFGRLTTEAQWNQADLKNIPEPLGIQFPGGDWADTLILQLVQMQMAVTILESSLVSQHPAQVSRLQSQVCPQQRAPSSQDKLYV